MEIHAAVAKINKYATSESGDTLEIVERPNGGISIVLADGQTSGKGAKINFHHGGPQSHQPIWLKGCVTVQQREQLLIIYLQNETVK